MFQLRPKFKRVLKLQKINFNSLPFRLFIWFPVFLYAGLIFYLSGLSFLPVIVENPFVDKLEHAIEYSIFGILLMRAFMSREFKLDRRSAFGWAVIVAFFYGISDEIHQAFVPGRTAAISDAFFDLIGSGLGAYIYPVKRFFSKDHI